MATITTPDPLPNPESKTDNRNSPYDSPTSTFYHDLITAYQGESILRRGTSTGLSSDPTIQELRNRLNNDLNNEFDAAKISMNLVFEEMRTQMLFLINDFPLDEMERKGGRVQHTPPQKSTLNPKARSPSQLVAERMMDKELKELRREQEQLKLEQELEQNRRNTSDQPDGERKQLRM
jgi:hypothetical protein